METSEETKIASPEARKPRFVTFSENFFPSTQGQKHRNKSETKGGSLQRPQNQSSPMQRPKSRELKSRVYSQTRLHLTPTALTPKAPQINKNDEVDEKVRLALDKTAAKFKATISKQQEEINRKAKLAQESRNKVKQHNNKLKQEMKIKKDQKAVQQQKEQEEEKKQILAEQTPEKLYKQAQQQEQRQQEFFERNCGQKPERVIYTDKEQYKKRNGIDKKTKIFICKGGYPQIRKSLIKRGWVENEDNESPFFDLKWTMKQKHIDHANLQKGQKANHFYKIASIVTKNGLTSSLKNLVWWRAEDMDTFYPRCYELSGDNPEEVEEFIQEFKMTKAQAFIIKYIRVTREAFKELGKEGKQGTLTTENAFAHTKITQEILKTSILVSERRLRDLDDMIDDPKAWATPNCTDKDWKILSSLYEMSKEQLSELKKQDWINYMNGFVNTNNATGANQRIDYSQPSNLAKKRMAEQENSKPKPGRKKEESEDSADDDYGNDYGDSDDCDDRGPNFGDNANDYESGDDLNPEEESKESRCISPSRMNNNQDKQFTAQTRESIEQDKIDRVLCNQNEVFKECLGIYERLKEKFPQTAIDGDRNIWIIKPCGSSRGRGIVLYKNLVQIVDHACKSKHGRHFIAQKYIERPLVCCNRKFDLRQWVLVTEWNPLTVWMYNEPYIRFAGQDFDLNKIDNSFAHLSNNAIIKNMKGTQNQSVEIDGNMWSLDEFQSWLNHEYQAESGQDIWKDILYKKVKNVCLYALQSVQDMIDENNKLKGRPFELFGYDVMVDENLNCWLIEVNHSPAMDYSTEVTSRLVKMVLEDTIKVVVDYDNAPDYKKKDVDTGGFNCIYKGKGRIEGGKQVAQKLEIQGKKIKDAHLKKY